MKVNNVISIHAKRQISSPVHVYLDTLTVRSRCSQLSLLKSALMILGFKQIPQRYDWSRIRYEYLVKIRCRMLEQGKSINTVNTTLAALRGVIRTAFYMELINADQLMRLTAIKYVQGETLPTGRALSRSEVKKLMESVPRGSSPIHVRDRAILAVLVMTGLRRAELVALKVSDYVAETGELAVRAGKGRKQRIVQVPVMARNRLEKWLRYRDSQNQALFCRIRKNGVVTDSSISTQAIYNMVRDYAKQAGIGKCTPHDLRRTYITRLIERGTDLNTVRKQVGHQDMSTTMIYDKR